MKPKLKAPGSKQMKLVREKLLSIFGFNFNLRRYTKGVSIELSFGFRLETYPPEVGTSD